MKFPSVVPLSKEGKDFIKKLTVKDKRHRLGVNGVKEIMNHEWFGDLDWEAIKNKNTKVPFYPNT